MFEFLRLADPAVPLPAELSAYQTPPVVVEAAMGMFHIKAVSRTQRDLSSDRRSNCLAFLPGSLRSLEGMYA